MTTLLDKQRSATSNAESPDEATLDQVLSRISALAPVVAQYARDMEQDRRLLKDGSVGTDLRHSRTPALQRA